MLKGLIYVSGPYTDENARMVTRNILRARREGIRIMKRGYAVIVPHLNCAGFERAGLLYETILSGDIDIIARCDAVYMMPNWQKSKGARIEQAFATSMGLPIYYSIDDLL